MPSSEPASSPAAWTPPSIFELDAVLPAQYRVRSVLDQGGGVGAVYLATQTNPDRDVAIRILPLREAAGADTAETRFAEVFKREGPSMVKRNQPGNLPVYDFGETDDGLIFIVMEYADGTDVTGSGISVATHSTTVSDEPVPSGKKKKSPEFVAAILVSGIALLALLAWLLF